MNLFDTIKFGSVIGKYLTGKESRDEVDQIKRWVNGHKRHQQLFASLKEGKEIAGSVKEFDRVNKEFAWQRYVNQIRNLSLQKRLIRWKIAAVFFFLISCAGILAYLNEDIENTGNEIYTTVSTGNGQSAKILLPDSSVVWINSGTSLSYNTDFSITSRKIKLSGQAFFQIARNEKMPLMVTSNELQVTVLGTKFDISAYPEDSNVNVVLESGSIKLTHIGNKTFNYLLKPGEKAEFNKGQNELSISDVDTYKYTSWKDGIMIFKDDPMAEVFEKLERWYNIEVEVKNQNINQKIFNATIVNESMKEILELIRFTCSVNYEIIPSDNPKIPVKVIMSSN